MTSAAPACAASEPLLPAAIPRLSWQRWLSTGLSVALLIALVLALRNQGSARLAAALPLSPLFWLAFAASYLALPVSELLIYRRLWGLSGSAFPALLRKLVSNDLVLGYSGELYFYLFARRHAGLTTSPFHTVKDVSILSAVAGNVATLALVALAWPVWSAWHPELMPSNIYGSLIALAAATAVICTLRGRIFALSRAQLLFVGGVHLLRVATTTALMIIMWKAALPQVAITVWVALAAIQLVVTRLPFIPGKEVIFAGVALALAGPGSQIGTLMALIASFLVVTHVAVGLGVIVLDFAQRRDMR